jgi:hypothetical protein
MEFGASISYFRNNKLIETYYYSNHVQLQTEPVVLVSDISTDFGTDRSSIHIHRTGDYF